MAAIVGVLIFDSARPRFRATKPFRVAAVQSTFAKIKSSIAVHQENFRSILRLTEIALRSNPPPDLLVWPESSMPGPVLADQESHKFVMDLAASAETDLLLGRST